MPEPSTRQECLAAFSQTLRRCLQAAGLSRRELAQLVGVKYGAVKRWALGKFFPGAPYFQRLEQVLAERGVDEGKTLSALYRRAGEIGDTRIARRSRNPKWQSFGDLIREKRLAARMTQRELAEKLGVFYGTLLNWERGGVRPMPLHSQQLAIALHAPEIMQAFYDDKIEEARDVDKVSWTLLYLRARSGLNRVQFAKSIGVALTTYSKWERGQKLPYREQILAAADALNSQDLRELADLPEILSRAKSPRRTMRTQTRLHPQAENAIYLARTAANMTTEELARRIGTSVAQIQHWEHGEVSPSRNRRQLLAKILKAPHLLQYDRDAKTKDLRTHIAASIRQARTAAHISLRALAKQLGSSCTSVILWEQGRVLIKQRNLDKLAEILNSPDLANLLNPPTDDVRTLSGHDVTISTE